MKWLKYSALIGLLLVAATILAWGPKSTETLPPGRVVVDYWEKWNADEGAQMQEIVTDFNNDVGAKENIYVRYISTSNVNQKTLVATAAGVPPDIAGLWDPNLVQFASLDALEPLEELAAAKGITAATYKPVYWNTCMWDGHLYGLISTPGCVALHYNKRIFRENAVALKAAGLDPDQPPQTLDELDAYAKVMDKVTPSGQILRSGYLPLEPGWYVAYSYVWFGGEIWDPVNHKFTLTSKPVVDSLKWIQSYSTRLGKDAMVEFRGGMGTFDSPQNPFLAGSMVMEQQGPWMANYILNEKPEFDGLAKSSDEDVSRPVEERQARSDWAVAPFPSAVPGAKNVTFCASDIFVIPKGAKHKKEAFEFIAYVNSQKVMEKLCNMHSKNTPLAKVSDEFLNHHKNPYIRVFNELADSPNARSIPQIPIMPEVVDELNNVVQRVALLRGEPLESLQDAQNRLQEKYDVFMEKQRARGIVAAVH